MLIFFTRLRRAIKDILFAFSSKIAYGSLRISAKDENSSLGQKKTALEKVLFFRAPSVRYKGYFVWIFCIKTSAKDENDFGQDEIDIMEKNEDENNEKMKMTSSLKKMRMEIALFPTLNGSTRLPALRFEVPIGSISLVLIVVDRI